MSLVTELGQKTGVRRACQALEIPRSSFYRLKTPYQTTKHQRPVSHRKLPEAERKQILAVLVSEKYADISVRQVYFDLLSQGIFMASVRTMYRILASEKLVKDRRNQRRHPRYHKPVVRADGPNPYVPINRETDFHRKLL